MPSWHEQGQERHPLVVHSAGEYDKKKQESSLLRLKTVELPQIGRPTNQI